MANDGEDKAWPHHGALNASELVASNHHVEQTTQHPDGDERDADKPVALFDETPDYNA